MMSQRSRLWVMIGSNSRTVTSNVCTKTADHRDTAGQQLVRKYDMQYEMGGMHSEMMRRDQIFFGDGQEGEGSI